MKTTLMAFVLFISTGIGAYASGQQPDTASAQTAPNTLISSAEVPLWFPEQSALTKIDTPARNNAKTPSAEAVQPEMVPLSADQPFDADQR